MNLVTIRRGSTATERSGGTIFRPVPISPSYPLFPVIGSVHLPAAFCTDAGLEMRPRWWGPLEVHGEPRSRSTVISAAVPRTSLSSVSHIYLAQTCSSDDDTAHHRSS